MAWPSILFALSLSTISEILAQPPSEFPPSIGERGTPFDFVAVQLETGRGCGEQAIYLLGEPISGSFVVVGSIEGEPIGAEATVDVTVFDTLQDGTVVDQASGRFSAGRRFPLSTTALSPAGLHSFVAQASYEGITGITECPFTVIESAPTPTPTPTELIPVPPTPTEPALPPMSLDIHPIQVVQDPPGDLPLEDFDLVRNKATMVRVFVVWTPSEDISITEATCRLVVAGVTYEITADLYYFGGQTWVIPVESRRGFDNVRNTSQLGDRRIANSWESFNFLFPETGGFHPQIDPLTLVATLQISSGTRVAANSETFAVRAYRDDRFPSSKFDMRFLWIESDSYPSSSNPRELREFARKQFQALVATFPIPRPDSQLFLRPKPYRITGGLSTLSLWAIAAAIDSDSSSIDRFGLILPGATDDNDSMLNVFAWPFSYEGYAPHSAPRWILIDENADRFTAAHEHFHQLVDDLFEHDDAARGADGWDVVGVSQLPPQPDRTCPSINQGLMNSSLGGGTAWSSVSDYQQMMTELTTVASAGQRGTRGPTVPTALVMGTFDIAERAISLAPILPSTRPGDVSDPDGELVARTLDSEGHEIGEYRFSTFRSNAAAADRQGPFFAFHMPFSNDVEFLEVALGDLVVASMHRSASAPTVEVHSVSMPAEDRYHVELSADDADGDTVHIAAGYSPDGLQYEPVQVEWLDFASAFEFDSSDLPGSEQATLRLLISDGMNTTEVISAPFSVRNKMPLADIDQPVEPAIFSFEFAVELSGAALDAEEGLLSGSALRWRSSVDGDLGSGGAVTAHLTPGIHLVTLEAVDNAGAVGAAQIEIEIRDDEQPDLYIASAKARPASIRTGNSFEIAVVLGYAGPATSAELEVVEESDGEFLKVAATRLLLDDNASLEIGVPAQLVELGVHRLMVRARLDDSTEPDLDNNSTELEIRVVETGSCTGDCNRDGEVTVDEIVLGVGIALGQQPILACLVFDSDGNGNVQVFDIITALNAALSGCPNR